MTKTKTQATIAEKPIAWLRIEAADEARCDSEENLAVVKPAWKIAQKEMNDSEEALLDAQSAARERFKGAYDEETSKSLSRLTKDFEEKTAAFRRIDSKKRHLDDEVKKLREGELKMIAEARDPDLFAAGEKLGPNGWQRVRLRDLTGHPDMSKDPEKQVWKSMELEKHGYDTIQQYLQGRGRLIPRLVDDGEIAATTLGEIDTVVWRFLDRRGLLDRWPKGVEPPKGEQMILQPETSSEPAFDGEREVPGPTLTTDDKPLVKFKVPSAAELLPGGSKGDINAVSLRMVELMTPWETLGEEHELLFALTDDEARAMTAAVGLTPYEAVSYILCAIDKGQDIEPHGVPDDKFSRAINAWLLRSSELGHEAGVEGDYDEVTAWFMRQVIGKGAEAVRRVSVWSPDLGANIAAYRDSAGFDDYEPKPTPFERATKKKKTVKKKATKKKVSKKRSPK